MAQLIKRFGVGVVTLAVVYAIVHFLVTNNRKPGSMTVVEAQAMDMNAMAANTPVGAIPVAAEEVSLQTFVPRVTYTGTVVAFNDTEIYPRVTGTVIAIMVYPGDHVRAGQVVARLDSAELSSKANEADAARIAMEHDVIVASQEQRMSEAQKRSTKAKATGAQQAQRDTQAQVTSAEAMRDQTERELEAAQTGPADSEAGVAAAEADLAYWQAEIAREGKLFQAKAVSREEFEREKAQAKTAEAKLTQAQAAVREKKAMIAAGKSKVRQAEANIVSARAKMDQSKSAIEGALADLAAAETNQAAFTHKVEHHRALVNQASAQKRTAEILRGYTDIRAAQDGTVTERLVSPGTLVQPGIAILKIKSSGQVRFQANIAQADLAGVRVGSAVTVTKPQDASFHLQSRISSIFSSANPQTRTVTVEALTSNSGGRFLPGEYIAMEIATAAPRQALTVPLESVVRNVDQKPFVWTLAVSASQGGKTIYTCVMHPEVISDKPGKCPKCGMDLTPKNKSGKFTAHRTFVTLGPSDGNRVVVVSGLDAGQQVLYRGQEGLNEGDPVTPVGWSATGPKTLPESGSQLPSMPGMKMDSGDSKMPGMDMGNMSGKGGR